MTSFIAVLACLAVAALSKRRPAEALAVVLIARVLIPPVANPTVAGPLLPLGHGMHVAVLALLAIAVVPAILGSYSMAKRLRKLLLGAVLLPGATDVPAVAISAPALVAVPTERDECELLSASSTTRLSERELVVSSEGSWTTLVDAIAHLMEVDAAHLRADLLPRVRELLVISQDTSAYGVDLRHATDRGHRASMNKGEEHGRWLHVSRRGLRVRSGHAD